MEYASPRAFSKLELEERLKRNSEAVKRRGRKVKQMAVEYKGGKCKICGYNKCVQALEFHHLDPTKKEFNISRSGHTMGWEKTKKRAWQVYISMFKLSC